MQPDWHQQVSSSLAITFPQLKKPRLLFHSFLVFGSNIFINSHQFFELFLSMNKLLFSLRLRILQSEARRLVTYHPGTKVNIVVESDWKSFEFNSSPDDFEQSEKSAFFETEDLQRSPSASSRRQKTRSFPKHIGRSVRRPRNAAHQRKYSKEDEEQLDLL